MQGKDDFSLQKSAPLFSSARFDEDSLFIYPSLAISTILLYLAGFAYYAIIPGLAIVGIFTIEALERVYLDPKGHSQQIVGEKCLVLRRVSHAESGVVKIIGVAGTSRWELWSARSNLPFEAGSRAKVKKRDGLFLEIEPLVQ